MGSRNCMNEVCRATTLSDSKKGWSLKSCGFASLCFNCGSAFENSIFCETFHSEDSGWRACRICGKMVHCGCVASRHLHEYMDFGGVACISCAKRLEIHSMQAMQLQIPSDIRNSPFVTKSVIRDPQPIVSENRLDENKFSTERLLQLTKSIGINEVTSVFEQHKRDESMLRTPENPPLQSSSSPAFAKSDNNRPTHAIMSESLSPLSHPSLNFTLTTTPLVGSSSAPPFHGGVVEGSEQGKGSLQRTRHVVTKPPKPSPGAGPESNKGSSSHIRVARPPAEGRGRSQLLPRYWPRITDQELQQLSGDLNSTIVPLFEKILSASDAGRIGRLVLPKACAEAYFPTINQSEGIPIKIQDIKGKEWTFQFRFWPNNNSRMYVLEGVTPCIQSMQVQAGDTVIFSRRDPGGQLVIGCRKATTNYDVQEPQTPAVQNGDPPENTSSSGGADNLQANGADDSQKQQMSLLEKKKARNIKNKRLHMHNDDAVELRITWEEAQELFRPSPSAEPTMVMVEDQEFEEFEEPPVFGKRTIFITQPSGEQEQVAQCDSCSKWRRLPFQALIPANWTCAENVWDTNRCSCSAPEDINLKDPELLKSNKEYKKQRTSDGKTREGEPSGLDALANAAVLGDNIGEIASGATTRHPRHRPGCTCIVCIQPPSGKGKHEPMCKCNVCQTVKRRFKTLMMRKKKRQSDREAELAQDNINKEAAKDSKALAKVDFGREDIAGHALLNMNHPRNETSNNNKDGNQMDVESKINSNSNNNIKNNNNNNNKGHLDLNCDPHREDDILAGTSGMSLTTLINTAGFPLDMYLGQNGIPGLGPSMLSRASVAVDENGGGEGGLKSGDVKQENNRADG